MSDNGTLAGCHVSGIAHSLLGKVGKLGMKSLPSWCPPTLQHIIVQIAGTFHQNRDCKTETLRSGGSYGTPSGNYLSHNGR